MRNPELAGQEGKVVLALAFHRLADALEPQSINVELGPVRGLSEETLRQITRA